MDVRNLQWKPETFYKYIAFQCDTEYAYLFRDFQEEIDL